MLAMLVAVLKLGRNDEIDLGLAGPEVDIEAHGSGWSAGRGLVEAVARLHHAMLWSSPSVRTNDAGPAEVAQWADPATSSPIR